MPSTDKFLREIQSLPFGWRKLATATHSLILEICPNYELVQIKSKLGAMRYYIDHSQIDDERSRIIMDIISAAERSSFSMCQNCGAQVESAASSWTTYNKKCKDCL